MLPPVEREPAARPRYRKVATLWLRVISIIFLLYALLGGISGLFYVVRPVPGEPRRAFVSLVLWGIGGAILWGLSGILGRLAARGLDDDVE